MKKDTCGLLAIKKILENYHKTKKIKSSSSDLVIRKKIPNNPYISSITGEFLLNLSKFKKLNIYFWKKMDDVNKNEAIKFILDQENTLIVDFTPFYKDKFNDAF